MKNLFTLMDDYLVIRSLGEIKNTKIFIPDLKTYDQRRQWLDNENYVYAIADNVKNELKLGDRVLISPHAKMLREKEVTNIVAATGVKVAEDVLDRDGKKIDIKEIEKYFIVTIKDVLCKVN